MYGRRTLFNCNWFGKQWRSCNFILFRTRFRYFKRNLRPAQRPKTVAINSQIQLYRISILMKNTWSTLAGERVLEVGSFALEKNQNHFVYCCACYIISVVCFPSVLRRTMGKMGFPFRLRKHALTVMPWAVRLALDFPRDLIHFALQEKLADGVAEFKGRVCLKPGEW